MKGQFLKEVSYTALVPLLKGGFIHSVSSLQIRRKGDLFPYVGEKVNL